MPSAPTETRPVTDSISKVNDEVAVGADLEFQRRWWRFEHIVWSVFTVIIILDLLGTFGKGPLARGHLGTQGGEAELNYERIERLGTPSIFTVQFGPAAIRDGNIRLWVSESLVKPLGNQRIIPQPAASVMQPGGIEYTFPATGSPASVEFELQPVAMGRQMLTLRVAGSEPLNAKIFVMP